MKDKVVLVTGASTGIGAATARAFLTAGATVYGTSRSLKEQEGGPRMLVMDQTDETSVDAAVGEVLAREGRLDILVNNAGTGIAGPALDTTPEELHRQLDVNLLGALRVSRAAINALIASRGMIINISSMAGVVPIPFQSGYSLSKFALESLSECMRMELAPLGVRVALVQPGDTKTAFTANRVTIGTVSEPYRARFHASVSRMEKDEQNGAPPESVARVVLRIARKKSPPVRVSVGLGYKALRTLRRFLPDKLASWIIAKLYA